MAGNVGITSSRVGGASISAAAATAAGSAETRFPPQEWIDTWQNKKPVEKEVSKKGGRRWGGCWGGFSCFGSQKRGKRIVPSSRIPDGGVSTNRANGFQAVGMSNQTITLTPSLLAPPSSPTSFTNSALPSTAQSPSCFLSMSANSPGGPSSTMFATGPYAHETHLVSPPVFSTFTTEPSTAPLTPPPELAHLTTPSSPDVPFAKFLSSSFDLKNAGKENSVHFISTGYLIGSDLQATYPLCPGSPTSSLISPVSGTPRTGVSSPFPDQETGPYSRNRSSKLFGLDTATSRNFMLSSHSSFFCPASSAQFHLDQAQQSSSSHPHNGGRLTISREADIHYSDGNRHNKTCKQDVEEIEAYRASFGFSADEIITTPNYVEISDVADDSFTMSPFLSNNKPCTEKCPSTEMVNGEGKMQKTESELTSNLPFNGVDGEVQDGTSNSCAGPKTCSQSGQISLSNGNSHASSDDEPFPKLWKTKVSKSFCSGQSISDAEIDYRRSRSSRDDSNILALHG